MAKKALSECKRRWPRWQAGQIGRIILFLDGHRLVQRRADKYYARGPPHPLIPALSAQIKRRNRTKCSRKAGIG